MTFYKKIDIRYGPNRFLLSILDVVCPKTIKYSINVCLEECMIIYKEKRKRTTKSAFTVFRKRKRNII